MMIQIVLLLHLVMSKAKGIAKLVRDTGLNRKMPLYMTKTNHIENHF